MRQAFIVTYDVRDPKRLRRVYRVLRGYGRHLQLSVFQCELDARERVELMAKLRKAVHHDEDQVLFVDIGPADGRGATSIESIGVAYVPEERRAIIV
ncbi:CRISPR-associated endonuclease Cas2 [Pendulispora albinea]|uniref:CRISPR-associated endoribonuclease Cas2 n=1 Tax=Pendulispora albinea TaxID=2741071 RepID=A0ABZ2MCE1_9BACT